MTNSSNNTQEIKELNRRIAACRKLAGFTQATAAQRLGLKRNTYARMELHGNPGAIMLMRIAELYGVSVNYLVYGEEAEETQETEIETITEPTKSTIRFASGINPNLMPPRFTPTNSELDLIKMYHYLPKDDQDEVKADIYSRYMKSKNKK